ncbi:MAG: hypothetical protein A3H91_12360 [Gammaproteobacteria bacterium RIFCSPLOWO2_02_FULL_61_13]|nr:MAG: hypothetical protein A3H91_12360 [Gammaproteobacteria bacterium RIFCSPLOWO2_02_FULL_61_13]
MNTRAGFPGGAFSVKKYYDTLRTRRAGGQDRSGDPPLLVQVCLETTAEETWVRVLRALKTAAAAYRKARARGLLR